jgi:DNA-directed RNA polymerase subunit RPC12/RpoP
MSSWQDKHIHDGAYLCGNCGKQIVEGVMLYWRKDMVCRSCFSKLTNPEPSTI